MLLRVVEALKERPLSIGKLFETCRCSTERVGTALQPFNGISWELFVLTHSPPVRTRLSNIPNSCFKCGPVLILIRGKP